MKRNKFSLSHYKLATMKMGTLVPISWFEALPGDTIQMTSSALLRCAPMVAPIMHPVQVRIHHWFVPNRIIWANWENFITGGPDGMDATAHPYINISTGVPIGSLGDYLGLPTSAFGGHVNALPYRAYILIWNEFYRDQDLQAQIALSTGDGNDTTNTYVLQNCDWEKDYLTSSRPWEVKGPSITLPLGTSAPVKTQASPTFTGAQQSLQLLQAAGTGITNLSAVGVNAGTAVVGSSTIASAASGIYPSNLYADLSSATAVTINTLRHALALQRFEEARARYGSRYTEYLRYLGVRSSDARLQRPEYLGGGRQTIQFSEVLQTAEGTNPVATMRGHGISAQRSNRFRRFFEEHGIVMTLLSVRPRTMYSQRLPRAWMRGQAFTGLQGGKEDYWQCELQHIGQQNINALEADASAGNVSFGFQDRYDEYRRSESSVAGLFRSTLDFWHLAREFGSAPALNSTFVSCVPSTRTFADTTNDNLYVMCNHSIQARRLLSKTGTSMTF